MQILYGLGNVEAEGYVRSKIGSDFVEVGAVSHRLAILETMEKEFNATTEAVLVLQEGLPSKEEISLLDLISQIRVKYSNVRIVLLGGQHEPGDAMLTALVGMGVYDILFGQKCRIDDAVDLILHPTPYGKALQYTNPKSYNMVAEKESPMIVARVEEEQPVETPAVKLEEERVYPKKLKTPQIPEAIPEDIPLDIAPPLVIQQTQLPVQKNTPKPNNRVGGIGKTKIVSFVSSIAGMGNREIALSVATGLAAKGEKVVLMDCTNEQPMYLSRLDFANATTGIYGAIHDVAQGSPIRQSLYSPAVDVHSSDFKRLSRFPNSLFFLTFTLNDKQFAVSFDDFQNVVDSLCKQGIYDTIVICCSHLNNMEFIERLIHLSTIPYITTTQSSYAFRMTELIANRMDISTVRLLLNKYEKGIQPSVATAKRVLGVSAVDVIPCDHKGFLMADSYALPYILTKSSSKAGKAIHKITQTIQKG